MMSIEKNTSPFRVAKRVLVVYDNSRLEGRFVERMTKLAVHEPFHVSVSSADYRALDVKAALDTDMMFFANDEMFLQELYNPRYDRIDDAADKLNRIYQQRPNLPVVISSWRLPEGDMSASKDLTRSTYVANIRCFQNARVIGKPTDIQSLSDAILEFLFFHRDNLILPDTHAEIISLRTIDARLISHLAAHADDLYRLSGRMFEELICELLNSQGWNVELTPYHADGGIDIIAVQRHIDLPEMMLVQAKRYAKDRKVGIAAVRELLHVVDDKRATRGMLVTTTGFTSPAMDKQRVYQWRISLKGYSDIVTWLGRYPRGD